MIGDESLVEIFPKHKSGGFVSRRKEAAKVRSSKDLHKDHHFEMKQKVFPHCNNYNSCWVEEEDNKRKTSTRRKMKIVM